jgi:AcrR family transcriptional regulator
MDHATQGTRGRILDTALALLNQLGYDKLTQPQVAKAAGITQGHLTYYFPTRSNLLLAVAEHSLRSSMSQFLERSAKAGANPDMAATMVRQALLDKARTRTILGLVIASDSDREIKKPLREMVKHARSLAAALLGAAGSNATPQQATLLHACLVGLSVVTFAMDSPKSDRELGDAAGCLLALMVKGNAQKERRPARGTASRRKQPRPDKEQR